MFCNVIWEYFTYFCDLTVGQRYCRRHKYIKIELQICFNYFESRLYLKMVTFKDSQNFNYDLIRRLLFEILHLIIEKATHASK